MAQLQVGFGREIYSPDTPIRIRYQQYTNKILTEVMVTCVALSDGEHKALIFSNDFRNFIPEFVQDVKDMISAETGICQDHIMVTCTHNHSGPDISYYKDPDISDWWERIGAPATKKAAKDALADLADCKVKTGTETVENVAFVRRYFRTDGTFNSIEGGGSDAPLARHETEADTELRAIRFVREGKKDVVIANFQVHAATAAGPAKEYVCADFLYKFRQTVEESGEYLALYLQGGCGNINTYCRIPGNTTACNSDYDKVGLLLGLGTLKALENATDRKADSLWVTTEEYTGICAHDRDHQVEAAQQALSDAGKMKFSTPKENRAFFEERGFSSRVDASSVITKSKLPKTQQIPLSTICFGEVGMTFAPFEMFDTNCVQIRKASPFATTLTVCYANGRHHYLPDTYAFSNKGYEPGQCFYVPGTGETVCLELLSQLKKAKDTLK